MANAVYFFIIQGILVQSPIIVFTAGHSSRNEGDVYKNRGKEGSSE